MHFTSLGHKLVPLHYREACQRVVSLPYICLVKGNALCQLVNFETSAKVGDVCTSMTAPRLGRMNSACVMPAPCTPM